MNEWSFTPNLILASIHKDVLPYHYNSLIYLFRYSCGWSFIGKTNQRLDAKIKHVPKKIRKLTAGTMDNLRNTSGPSIAELLISNYDCAEKFKIYFFSVKSHSSFESIGDYPYFVQQTVSL